MEVSPGSSQLPLDAYRGILRWCRPPNLRPMIAALNCAPPAI